MVNYISETEQSQQRTESEYYKHLQKHQWSQSEYQQTLQAKPCAESQIQIQIKPQDKKPLTRLLNPKIRTKIQAQVREKFNKSEPLRFKFS